MCAWGGSKDLPCIFTYLGPYPGGGKFLFIGFTLYFHVFGARPNGNDLLEILLASKKLATEGECCFGRTKSGDFVPCMGSRRTAYDPRWGMLVSAYDIRNIFLSTTHGSNILRTNQNWQNITFVTSQNSWLCYFGFRLLYTRWLSDTRRSVHENVAFWIIVIRGYVFRGRVFVQRIYIVFWHVWGTYPGEGGCSKELPSYFYRSGVRIRGCFVQIIYLVFWQFWGTYPGGIMFSSKK